MSKRTERPSHNDTLMPLDSLVAANGNRRSFLRRSVKLGLIVPLLGAAPQVAGAQDDEHGHEEPATPAPIGSAPDDEHADEDDHGGETDEHNEAPVPSETVQPFIRYDPFLRPVEPGPKDITVVAQDATLFVAKDVPFAGWTYDGTIPGRTVRVVEGDPVNVTFRIDAAANAHHSLDFHSAKTPPDASFRTINPGEEMSWSFVAKHPGAYMYHCGTPRILMHIGSGLYGAMIVDPKDGWSPAQELILVQSDLYLTDGPGGVHVPDYEKMVGGGEMDYVVFNGYANQYVDDPIRVRVGAPVRIFVVNAGPNVWSSFHVVGTVFDRAYVNASPKNELFDLQSITVGPGDSACVEFTLDEPGAYPMVNHAFGHTAHGAVAMLQAE